MFNYKPMNVMKSFLTQKLPLVAVAVSMLFACDTKKTNRRTEPEVKQLDHLIIEEVAYAGVWTPQNVMDKDITYLKITNPTSRVVYLDGLGLIASAFSSDQLLELGKDADFTKTHINALRVMKFPGNGQQYPLAPGKSVIVTGAAIDHRAERVDEDGDPVKTANPHAFDLSGANFEWLTKEQLESDDYVDNAKVPNMLPVYSGGDWEDPEGSAFKIGNGLLALIKFGATTEELKQKDYEWSWYSNNSAGGHGHAKNGKCLKLPNAWVIDAVNICPKHSFKWYIAAQSIDAGFASVRLTSESDKQIAGKVIVRRHDGRSFVDTNNSTQDFEVKDASILKK